MGWMRERDCGQHTEALAKGEPRVNTDSNPSGKAHFWKPSPNNNGYNCFPPLYPACSTILLLLVYSKGCCWHAIVALLLLKSLTPSNMEQGLNVCACLLRTKQQAASLNTPNLPAAPRTTFAACPSLQYLLRMTCHISVYRRRSATS